MKNQPTERTNRSSSRPRRVLVVRNALAYDFGGAERLAVHIALELKLSLLETIVISRQPRLLAYSRSLDVPTRRGWWWTKQNWSGKSILLFPLYVIWQTILTLWYMQLFIRIRPSAVHLLSKDDFIAGSVAGRLLGKRVIWTDTADLKYIYANYSTWFRNPVGKLVFWASKLADNITLVSNNERRLVEDALGRKLPSQYIVVHIAGKDELVEPLKRDAADRDAVIFCSTSRLVAAKGISELVQAFRTLADRSSDYRLWLVGDGPDQARFVQEAADNPYIKFIGHADKPLPYVAASDIFVHPSYNEGFSLSLAEAAMLGKPMITTNVGGNPELVNEHNGLLVPVGDTGALTEAMKTLGTDKALRDALGQRARKDYVDNFDFATIIKDVIIPLYG